MTPRDEAIEAVAQRLLECQEYAAFDNHLAPSELADEATALVDHITPLLTRAALDAAEARLREAVEAERTAWDHAVLRYCDRFTHQDISATALRAGKRVE